MDTKHVVFEIRRDESGAVRGFYLGGLGESETEAFCYTFPDAVRANKATVEIKEGKLIFRHSGWSREGSLNPFDHSLGGEYVAHLKPEDACAFSQLLECEGPYRGCSLHVERKRAWGHGFELGVRR